ncbi:hypothetical protein KP509_13G078700 [Ceratopteris richardii]|nr:hypothetical protein KP509_13G078700 [Ceratopteris richardii]
MLPFHTLGGERSEAWMRHQIETQIQQINEYKAIIFNASPCLEPEVHACMKELLPSDKVFYTLGPLVPSSILSSESDDQGTGSSMFDEDEACVEWLDTQSPHSVLYISLGSLITFYDEAELQEFTSGLLDSKQPFLWVFRPSALLPTPRMECSFGKIIEWAPQLRVLAHNAVGGFLTHCGWNSTLESLLMGVPVLGWPQMLDQTTNCWFLTEKLKVGLRLESMQSKKVDHKSLENSIRRLMVGEEAKLFRARANEVRDMAKEACTQSSLSSVLESLVSTIVSLNHTK